MSRRVYFFKLTDLGFTAKLLGPDQDWITYQVNRTFILESGRPLFAETYDTPAELRLNAAETLHDPDKFMAYLNGVWSHLPENKVAFAYKKVIWKSLVVKIEKREESK